MSSEDMKVWEDNIIIDQDDWQSRVEFSDDEEVILEAITKPSKRNHAGSQSAPATT